MTTTTPSPIAVEFTVTTAPMPNLVAWLTGHYFEFDGRAVPCPRCQATEPDLAMHAPAAIVHRTGMAVICGICRASITRWALIAEVLGDPLAVARVLEDIGGAG